MTIFTPHFPDNQHSKKILSNDEKELECFVAEIESNIFQGKVVIALTNQTLYTTRVSSRNSH
jgi:hypothetical protein